MIDFVGAVENTRPWNLVLPKRGFKQEHEYTDDVRESSTMIDVEVRNEDAIDLFQLIIVKFWQGFDSFSSMENIWSLQRLLIFISICNSKYQQGGREMRMVRKHTQGAIHNPGESSYPCTGGKYKIGRPPVLLPEVLLWRLLELSLCLYRNESDRCDSQFSHASMDILCIHDVLKCVSPFCKKQ